jgi:chaperonin GroEL
MEVKKGIEMASKAMIQFLENIKLKITNDKELFNLAMITTNHNEKISKIVSSALNEVGLKGLIMLEESNTGETHLKVEEGMFINNGLASEDYIADLQEDSIYLDNPLILVLSDSINEISGIMRILEYAKSIERSLLIFSPEIKQEPLSILLYNKRKSKENVNLNNYKIVHCSQHP